MQQIIVYCAIFKKHFYKYHVQSINNNDHITSVETLISFYFIQNLYLPLYKVSINLSFTNIPSNKIH